MSTAFVCLFGFFFLHTQKLFNHMRNLPLPILGTRGFLACHTYCNKGQVISEDPIHSHLLSSV